MKTVLATAENVEQQIDLAVGFKDEAHSRPYSSSSLRPPLFVPEPGDEGAQFIEQL